MARQDSTRLTANGCGQYGPRWCARVPWRSQAIRPGVSLIGITSAMSGSRTGSAESPVRYKTPRTVIFGLEVQFSFSPGDVGCAHRAHSKAWSIAARPRIRHLFGHCTTLKRAVGAQKGEEVRVLCALELPINSRKTSSAGRFD